MTTPLAAAIYEMEHIQRHENREIAIYNPHNKPIDELKVIFGFNNGGRKGWLHAVLLSQDGDELGGHI